MIKYRSPITDIDYARMRRLLIGVQHLVIHLVGAVLVIVIAIVIDDLVLTVLGTQGSHVKFHLDVGAQNI